MKKAVIMGFINFPRGSAPANYVQYLGLALKDLGYQVIVYSNVNSECRELEKHNKEYEYRGITVRPIVIPATGKITHFIQYNFMLGGIMASLLKECDLACEDIVLTYGNICLFQEKVYAEAKKYGAKTFACITEHFPAAHYRNGIASPYYWRYCYTMAVSIPQAKNIFPISRHLDAYYQKKKCNTLLLPIMADPYEYSLKQKKSDGIHRIVFPSNGFVKDALKDMLNGISSFTEEELRKVEIHFTGIGLDKLKANADEKFISLIGKQVIVHSWLEYSELVELYQQMDYLLLAREDNQMTRANFPSKVPEVMCYGIIPIVSKVGDYTDIYLKDGKNSIIFEGCSAQACLEALRRAINMSQTEKENLSQGARKCAENDFFYQKWEKRISDFIVGKEE